MSHFTAALKFMSLLATSTTFLFLWVLFIPFIPATDFWLFSLFERYNTFNRYSAVVISGKWYSKAMNYYITKTGILIYCISGIELVYFLCTQSYLNMPSAKPTQPTLWLLGSLLFRLAVYCMPCTYNACESSTSSVVFIPFDYKTVLNKEDINFWLFM